MTQVKCVKEGKRLFLDTRGNKFVPILGMKMLNMFRIIEDLALSPFNKSPFLQMRRYFVEASSETPTKDCGVNTSEFLKRINKTKLAQVVQNFTMFPEVRAHSYVPAVKQVSWSPCVENVPYGSLLTILNNSGALEIRSLKRGTWELVSSISKVWVDYWKTNWIQIPVTRSDKEILNTLKERTYTIKITAFTWGCVFEGGSSLFTSNMVGQVAIWSINRGKIKEAEERVKLLHIIQTDIGHITSIFFQRIYENKCLLLVSSLDGRIQSIPIDYSNNVFNVGKSCLIWSDQDKIQLVPNGAVSVIWDNTAVFTVAKGGHLIVFQLNEEGHQLNTCIHDSEDIALTGLVQLSEDEVMFTTRNGSVSLLSLGKGLHQFKPTVSLIQSSFRSAHYACHGFALSRSKVIGAFSYSVCKLYDHLPLREPSQMIWCSFSGPNSASEVIKKPNQSLGNIWDAIETIRIDTILSNRVMDFPGKMDLDVMDLYELKKYLWFTHISLFVMSDQESRTEVLSLNEEITILVVSCNVFKRITNLMSTTNISDFDQRSIMVMKHWLEYLLANLNECYEITRGTASTLLEQLDDIQTQYHTEKCVICGSKIPQFTGYIVSACAKGHSVPRCSLSLVQCDVLPYYNCYHCGAIAHPEAVSDSDNTCILCDNQLRIDECVSDE